MWDRDESVVVKLFSCAVRQWCDHHLDLPRFKYTENYVRERERERLVSFYIFYYFRLFLNVFYKLNDLRQNISVELIIFYDCVNIQTLIGRVLTLFFSSF